MKVYELKPNQLNETYGVLTKTCTITHYERRREKGKLQHQTYTVLCKTPETTLGVLRNFIEVVVMWLNKL